MLLGFYYGGLRSCFARIIPFSPFPVPGCSKNCRGFHKWCLESCFGISYFLSLHYLFFIFFLAHSSGFVFCTLWRKFFVLSLLYSRTLRLSCVEPN